MDTVCRAITFPFTPHSVEWKELNRILNQAWQISTQLANWAMTLVHRLDQELVFRKGRPEKLPAMSADKKGGIYLYEHLRTYPDRDKLTGIMQSVQTTLRGVRAKYKAIRFDVLWRRCASLPSFRYPYPFALHNKDWSAYFGKDNIPLVSVKLPGGEVVLRLRGGPEMKRQLDSFKKIVNGAKPGEATIYKTNSGKCLIKLVAHFPAPAIRESSKTLLVRTDPNAFWVAEMDGIEARIWNEDHIRNRVEVHRIRLQRISEDTKREKCASRRNRRQIDSKRYDLCRKQNDWLTTTCHEISSQLIGFALRQHVGTLIYDDENKDWLTRFPWSRLETMVSYKCKDRGIKFVSASELKGATT